MAGISLTVDDGVFQAKASASRSRLNPLAGTAMKRAAEQVLRESQAVVPVETGTLRDSGYVDGPSGDNPLTMTIGYTAPYAVFVHEGHRIVAWGHDTGRMQPPNKFLEPVVNAHADDFATGIARDVGAALKGIWG